MGSNGRIIAPIYICIYLVEEARWKWGVMGGSHGGETAALHRLLLPPHVLALLILYFPYLYLVFSVFVLCIFVICGMCFHNSGIAPSCVFLECHLALGPSFLLFIFWLPFGEFGGKEPGLTFTPEKPSLHTRQSVRTFAQDPLSPSDWPLHALILNPSCLLATARLQTPFPSHFLHSHFALSAAIL